MRVPVCIVGAGPAGLLLSQLLYVAGVDSIVLEQRSRAYVESRLRAGVLEPGTVALLERAGAAVRLHAEGLVHGGFSLSVDGEAFRIDLAALTGKSVTVYGQTELTRDLIATILQRPNGGGIVFEAERVALHDVDSAAPSVTWRKGGEENRADCGFVAGCDGFHGICRQAIPAACRREFERAYPFGWLGILADVPPCCPEVMYASHERGFALASMRSATRSRYYIQIPADEDLALWPDERFWNELAIRLGPAAASAMQRGPSLEKSIAPLRSFVCEPMRHGRLFLAGDAAHIVPPTGAKGLNLAAGDVALLADALTDYYMNGAADALDRYSATALARVWKAERFSWWLTSMMHRFPDADGFGRKMQLAEIDHVRESPSARLNLAANYAGLSLR